MKKSYNVGYAKVHEILCQAYEQNHYRALPELKARRAIQTETGISFPPGTRIEDILEQLESHDLILKGVFHGSKEVKIIPLSTARYKK